MMFRCLLVVFCVCVIFIPKVQAQSGLDLGSSEPLEITADETLEWHRNELYFKAVKNVRAVQGGTTLVAAELTAKYRDGAEGGIDIYEMLAEGNVSIISAESKAYGDRAVYDVAKGYAVMTGKRLRLISDGQTVRASDKFQYWVNDGRLEAIGAAEAVRGDDKLRADKITAIFTEDKSGKRVLESMEAIGNVVITTPDEVLTGGRAVYKAASNVAELHDNVKIRRGNNVLEGKVAQVNLNTNVSKIIGGASVSANGSSKGSGRVRGVFYPGEVKSGE